LGGWVVVLVGLVVAFVGVVPPRFTDGFGLSVVRQPAWVDANQRTFTFTVMSDQVPAHTVLPYQVSGEHVIMVTLPAGYDDGAAATRYPVLYALHGGGNIRTHFDGVSLDELETTQGGTKPTGCLTGVSRPIPVPVVNRCRSNFRPWSVPGRRVDPRLGRQPP
jgi:hypothetical protein